MRHIRMIWYKRLHSYKRCKGPFIFSLVLSFRINQNGVGWWIIDGKLIFRPTLRCILGQVVGTKIQIIFATLSVGASMHADSPYSTSLKFSSIFLRARRLWIWKRGSIYLARRDRFKVNPFYRVSTTSLSIEIGLQHKFQIFCTLPLVAVALTPPISTLIWYKHTPAQTHWGHHMCMEKKLPAIA